MLHELLLALSGHGGSIFIEKEDYKFEVINEIPFFHPSEVSLLKQILNIGSHYKAITQFTQVYGNSFITDEHKNPGQYITALASSFEEVVHPYESAIIKLESDILEVPNTPLSQILLAIQPEAQVFASIVQLITQVKDDNIRGCKILEVVHCHVDLSVGKAREVLIKVEQAVHIVLYEQLTHWLLYGLLLDPHEELFIKAQIISNSNQEHSNTGGSLPDIEALSLTDVDQSKTTQEILLRAEMLPDHIPLEIAQKILFIGESILEFEGENRRNQELMTSTALVTSHSGQVLKDREEEFLCLIRELISAPTFSLKNFSEVVETIRNCVSEQLWTLVMEAGLLDELTDIKSVFLLGRGELYQAFINIATPRLNRSLAGNSYLNSLFKAAGRQVLLDDILEKFTLSLHPIEMDPNTDERGNIWNNLKLSYDARWPLYKLFGPSEQEKYNKIFGFLLDVRRAQYRLQHLWISQMQSKKIGSSKYETMLWTIRHHMTLLIDNLQYYLQVDVLESQYWQLITEIGKSKDYQRLVEAHRNFLSGLHYQCFLNHPVIYVTLNNLTSQVHEFCRFMETEITADMDLEASFAADPGLEKRVYLMDQNFEGASRRLFDILSTLKQAYGTEHTAQLIMRIDYNKYYSLNKSNIQSLPVSVQE